MSIDPKTGIRPMSEWGPECGEALKEKEENDHKTEQGQFAANPWKPITAISVWNGKYINADEEEYITWSDYIWSIQPPPSGVPPNAIRLSAICGTTRVEIRKVDEEHWHLFVLATNHKFIRQKNFNTFFQKHAQRTAEDWYGPAKDGWHVEQTKETS
jgi:hypothetical protein